MKKIAEILYQAYEKAGREQPYSQEYDKAYDKLRETLNKEQRLMLLDLEVEFIGTNILYAIDAIQYILELIHPEE